MIRNTSKFVEIAEGMYLNVNHIITATFHPETKGDHEEGEDPNRAYPARAHIVVAQYSKDEFGRGGTEDVTIRGEYIDNLRSALIEKE